MTVMGYQEQSDKVSTAVNDKDEKRQKRREAIMKLRKMMGKENEEIRDSDLESSDEDEVMCDDGEASIDSRDQETRLSKCLREIAKSGKDATSCGVSTDVFDPEFWRTIGGDKLHVEDETWTAGTDLKANENLPEDLKKDLLSSLQSRGYISDESVNYGEMDFPTIVSIVRGLMEKGWPPVFIFVYDELQKLWLLIHSLWSRLEVLLGEDCVLEPSFFAWAPQPKTYATKFVGNNFGLPHRDYPFPESCFPDHTAKLLNIWVPLTQATIDNGCMYVVPKEFDLCFDQPDSFAHMRSATKGKDNMTEVRFNLSGARPLIADPGALLAWNGNLIHWGSSCSVEAKDPRVSVAFAFRRKDVEQLKGDVPFPPITKVEALKVPLVERIRMIAKGMLLFRYWYALEDSMVPKEFFGKL